jgi:hypothetical protein
MERDWKWEGGGGWRLFFTFSFFRKQRCRASSRESQMTVLGPTA